MHEVSRLKFDYNVNTRISEINQLIDSLIRIFTPIIRRTVRRTVREIKHV
jgi:hypothetical protein